MSRPSAEECKAALGGQFAGYIHNGSTWVTGKLVAYCAEPTVTIEREDGTQIDVAVGTIGPFLFARPELPVR